MQDNFDKAARPASDDEEITPEIQEALAAYFEQMNGAETTSDPAVLLASMPSEVLAQWQQAMALLSVPQRAALQTMSVETAWQSFRARAFTPASVQQASLGGYVAETLAHSEQTALKESGLSRPTLEALKSDPTPLNELKGYKLNDYAALARRYGVEDSLFPRMLKWLKGLGNKLSVSSPGAPRGMVFARDEEPHQPTLTETELAQHLEEQKKSEED